MALARTAPSIDGLELGTPVQVRNRFNAEWAVDFLVAEVLPAGYRVRRCRDGALIPWVFAPSEIRPA